jgi:hypothetical protein
MEQGEIVPSTWELLAVRVLALVKFLPLVRLDLEALFDTHEGRELTKLANFAPSTVHEPLGSRIRHVLHTSDTTGEKEHPIVSDHVALTLLNACTEEEGEEELVLLE